jgi:hypothetical protein
MNQQSSPRLRREASFDRPNRQWPHQIVNGSPFSVKTMAECASGYTLWINRTKPTGSSVHLDSTCLKCPSCRTEISYSRQVQVVGQAYSPPIRQETSNPSAWMTLAILPSPQTATGSHTASFRVETGIFGSAIWTTAKRTDSPTSPATILNPPGPPTRKPWFTPATAGEPFGLPYFARAASTATTRIRILKAVPGKTTHPILVALDATPIRH